MTFITTGPEHALKMFDKFCSGKRLFGEENEYTWEESFVNITYIKPTCKVYKFIDGRIIDESYFKVLCKIFPILNMYYYHGPSGTVICYEYSVMSCYSHERNRIYTVDKEIADLLPQTEKATDFFDETFDIAVPDSFEIFNSYINYSLALNARSLADYCKTAGRLHIGNRCLEFLLRADSLSIISQYAYDAKHDCGNVLTPLMFAIKVGKIDEYRVMRSRFPKWIECADRSGRSVLHYCIITNNRDLFTEIFTDLYEKGSPLTQDPEVQEYLNYSDDVVTTR